MSLSHRILKAFVTVARSGSITRAAGQLRVSQPALTQSVRNLEAIVGTRLIDRSHRGVSLTQAGRQFLVVAEQLLDSMDRALDDLRSLAEARHGLLSVAGLPSVCCGFLPRMVAGFNAGHPNVRVVIHDGLADDVTERVKSGQCDMAVVCLTEPDLALHAEPLAVDELALLCRADHPLARRPRVTWADVARHRFIGLSKHSSTRQIVDRAFASVGHYLTPVYEVVNVTTVGSMVAEGLGVTVAPVMAATLIGSRPNLIWRRMYRPRIERSIALVRSSSRSLPPPAALFWEHVGRHRHLLTQGAVTPDSPFVAGAA